MSAANTLAERLARYPWPALRDTLDTDGYVVLESLLDEENCRQLRALYDDDAPFRSRVVMGRHGFGRGEYRYFDYPLPAPVATLRSRLYRELRDLANVWQARLGRPPYPPTLDAFLACCRSAGQTRPTPLLLSYGAGDFNRLHQDLYGAVAFPIQLTALLCAPGREFQGGEFVLTETRPRMQSRVQVVTLKRGDGVLFATSERPVAGSRGYYRVRLRHGVSTVRRGQRRALGVIFHDAV